MQGINRTNLLENLNLDKGITKTQNTFKCSHPDLVIENQASTMKCT